MASVGALGTSEPSFARIDVGAESVYVAMRATRKPMLDLGDKSSRTLGCTMRVLWELRIGDRQHVVELRHATVGGYRQILVDNVRAEYTAAPAGRRRRSSSMLWGAVNTLWDMGSSHHFIAGGLACEAEIRLEGSVLSPFLQFYTYRLSIEGRALYKLLRRAPTPTPAAREEVASVATTFQLASRSAKALGGLSEEDELSLHSLYRQATRGDCAAEPPSMLQFRKHLEWQAWKMCEGVPKKDAMLAYIAEVDRLRDAM